MARGLARKHHTWYAAIRSSLATFFGFLNLSYIVAITAISVQSFCLNAVFFHYYITEDGIIPLFIVEALQIL